MNIRDKIRKYPASGKALKYFIVFLWTLPATHIVSGQKIISAEFLIGGGNIELFHTGARFKIAEQTKLGVIVGVWPGIDKTPLIIEAETQFHLFGDGRNLEFKKWFLRSGWIYGETPRNNHVLDFTGPYLGFGKEWIVLGNLGLQLDAGVYFLPYRIRKYEFFNKKMPAQVTGGIRFQIFYRSSSFRRTGRIR